MHTNAEIAAFRDPDKMRAGWWKEAQWCNKCGKDHCSLDVAPGCPYTNPSSWRYTGPNFATDPIACFKELEPPLLAMDAHVHRYKDGTGVVWMGIWISSTEELKQKPYAAAISAAFSWAMDNEPEALRRACEEVG